MNVSNKKSYEYEFCNYISLFPSSMQIHTTIHTGENPFKCDLCGYHTARKFPLKTHMKTHSGEKT